ncbi:hypothetical protein [Opitutus terrae]|uniref:Outer membrane lipoprotein-sorting protein n=1 Tax=Opitutus terrae (strain DSM 11246 / JCM 15787 / PB90-1) TaxID=452637 RepID=B1ZS62_OPITP|nr:hypothetical protein [Opitutus terrae]ACB75661.1 hypothetical protein Oter_2379 [Opitutus terrae PB90-1]
MVRLTLLCSLILSCFAAHALRAEDVEELARIHVEAIGGRERLARIEALRARGHVVAPDQMLLFEMMAQRPNRVRITMRGGGRTLIQGTDGVAAPWRQEPERSPRAVPMSEAEGREFAADAEFDDPLASAAERGYQLDLAGETDWENRRVFRVLVTRRDTTPSYLLVDSETYFILARLTTQRMPSGRTVQVEMRYDDFRPVGGVIYPHRVETLIDDQRVRQTVLTSIQAIPAPPPEIFVMPGAAGAGANL